MQFKMFLFIEMCRIDLLPMGDITPTTRTVVNLTITPHLAICISTIKLLGFLVPNALKKQKVHFED